MTTLTRFAIFIIIALVCLYCSPKKSNEDTKSTESEQQAIESTKYKLQKVWASDTILKTPESVVFDAERNVLYVSNVNQNPWEKDNNGFISIMSKAGEILELEWITGFSGPKGMAIVANTLFVADLDELVLIDIEKGEIKEKVKVQGAEGMNDITPDGQGGVYMSDSPAGKIFQYSNGVATDFIAEAPGRPNGLFLDQGKLFTAFSQVSNFVYYNIETLEKTEIATDIGAGDGVTPTNEANTYLVSDWQGEVYIINTDGLKQSLLRTKDDGKNTADIWFILEEDLLLVPTFFDNRVVAYKLVKE
jgi:DNA-binding beta-propeller fold protein YncE